MTFNIAKKRGKMFSIMSELKREEGGESYNPDDLT